MIVAIALKQGNLEKLTCSMPARFVVPDPLDQYVGVCGATGNRLEIVSQN